jgi:hypothetical protein
MVQLIAKNARMMKKAKRYLVNRLQDESSMLYQLMSSGAGTSSFLIRSLVFLFTLYFSGISAMQQQQQVLAKP